MARTAPPSVILPKMSADEMRQALEQNRKAMEAAQAPPPAQQPVVAPPPPSPPPPSSTSAPVAPAPQAAPAQPQGPSAPTPPPAPIGTGQRPVVDVRNLRGGAQPVTLGQAARGAVATTDSVPEGVRDVAAAFGTDPQSQQVLDKLSAIREGERARAVQFLRARGYEEQITLLPEGINLPETRSKMEAAGLQKEARKRGYNNWFEVPEGDDKQRAEQDVAVQVQQDINRAATVGRGAIFIDPNPSGSEDIIAALPIPMGQKAALTALVPTTEMTMTPKGGRYRTENPAMHLLRAVNMIGSAGVAPVQAALEEADPIRRMSELRDMEARGDIDRETYLDGVGRVMSDSLKAATGIDLTDDQDWRDAFARDPEAQRKILERVKDDPAAFMVADQIADDLVRYYDAPDFWTHAALITTGAAIDLLTPDPVTPLIGAAGNAVRAGARLAGDSKDLERAASALRSASAQEGSAEQVANAVRDAAKMHYRGVDKVLEIRIGSRAQVPTDVWSQMRRLETEAQAAAERAARAQERFETLASEVEQTAAATEVLNANRDAARAQLEHAEAMAALAEHNRTVYKEVGAPAVREAERAARAAEEARATAARLSDEAEAIRATHEQALGRLDVVNQNMIDALSKRDEAQAALDEAREALKTAQASGPGKLPKGTKPPVPDEIRALDEQVQAEKEAHEQATKDLAYLRSQVKATGGKKGPAELKGAIEAQRARVARAEADLDILREQRKLAGETVALEAALARDAARAKRLEDMAAADARIAEAEARLAQAQQDVKQVDKTRRAALQDAEKPLKEMRDRTTRAYAELARAAELEEASGRRLQTILSGTADPNPGPMLRDMDGATKARLAQAALSAVRARDAFREAARAAAKGDKAALARAEQEIEAAESMMNAQMKADLARSRADIWRSEAAALADDIERGLQAIRTTPQKDLSREGLLAGTVLESKPGGDLIDTAAFREKMERIYTPEGVRWWVERAGDDRDLWARALGLAGGPEARVSAEEGLRLQMGEQGLIEGWKATRPNADAAAQVETLLNMRRDPAYRAAAFQGTNTDRFFRHIEESAEMWARVMDPTQQRVGDVNARMIEFTKAGVRITNNYRDELLMLGRLARMPEGWRAFAGSLKDLRRTPFGTAADMVRVMFRYTDSTEPLDVFGRKTIGNTGAENLWLRSKRQFQTDPRVATHEQLVQHAQQRGMSVEQLLRSDQPGVSNRPLLGLSRMWVKSGVGMSERQSAYLFTEARKNIATANSFEEFADLQRKSTQRSWTTGEMTAGGGFGPGAFETYPQKAIGYGARCVAQAAAQGDVNDLFIRALGGTMLPEEAADVARALTYEYDAIQAPGNVWSTLNRMGAPLSQTSIRDAESAVAQTQTLLQTGVTRGGESVFMLASQARALDDTLDKVVKETFDQYAEARDMTTALALKRLEDFQQFWKTSVTLGLLVPRPSYFMTNVFGNFSQMWLTAGPATAARISFQSLPYNVPFVGPMLDRMTRVMSDRVSGVPFLGTITNAWINPHLQKVFAGEHFTFRAKNGLLYDSGTLSKWLVEDGITTTFMQEEFSRLFSRAQGEGAWTRLRFLQDDIFAWAGEIEMRMRAALYMDLLQKGATRSEARDMTLRALYDWSGALSQIEANVFTWFAPFYRFIKLGMRQWFEECITLPFRRPNEATLRAALGQSGLARVAQQQKALTLFEMQDDGDYQNEQQKYDAMANYRGLDYLNKRVTWSEPNDLAYQELLRGTRGRYLPYSQVSMPGLTALDMGALAVLPFYAVGALGAGVAGELTGRSYLAPDWYQTFLDSALQMSGPLTQPLIAGWAQSTGFEGQGYVGDSARLKPGEAYLAQMVGLPVFVDRDFWSIAGTTATKAILSIAPLLLQAPSWMDAFALENPYAANLDLENDAVARDLGRWFAFGSRQMSGVGKRYPFNPDMTITQNQKKIGDNIRRVSERQAAEVREQQMPKP